MLSEGKRPPGSLAREWSGQVLACGKVTGTPESMSRFDRWWEEEAAIHVGMIYVGLGTESGNIPQ